MREPLAPEPQTSAASTPQKRHFAKAAVGAVIGVAAVVAGGWWSKKRADDAALAGDKLYAGAGGLAMEPKALETLFGLSFDDIAGKKVSFAQFKGKPLIVNFWATWCAPCIEEMPELDTWNKEAAGKIAIVGIGVDSTANLQQFAAKNTYSYPLLVAGMGGTELARIFGNTAGGLPYTIVVSSQGEVSHRKLGRFSLAELKAAAL